VTVSQITSQGKWFLRNCQILIVDILRHRTLCGFGY